MSEPLKRWMSFVDGENLTIRSQYVAAAKNIELCDSRFYEKNRYIWFPNPRARVRFPLLRYEELENLQNYSERSFYYTSVSGDQPTLQKVREALWQLGFHPEVFKKDRPSEKAKGVDIALTKDMLSNAFLDNYDVAVLFAGDGDFVPVVNEVKRLGKQVYVVFFSGVDSGLSDNLRLASDNFVSLNGWFEAAWRQHSESFLRSQDCSGAPGPSQIST